MSGEGHTWNHYKVKSDDKNIDRICEVWYDYGIQKLKDGEDNRALASS